MNSARDLAATGIPGPWTAHEGDLEGGTLVDYVTTLFANRNNDGTSTGRLFLTLAPNDIDPENGAEVIPAMTGDGPRAEQNAAKIVRAVNALGPLGNLLDTVAADHRQFRESCVNCGGTWPCEYAAARDAVEAALRGED